jgi:serine/threonine protein kinase
LTAVACGGAGLQAMRRLNWVHRDLKPGNLLLSRESLAEAAAAEGGLKIGDFGFARDLAPEGLAETWVRDLAVGRGAVR